ncbi:uncharacterized protein LOC143352205 [Halictus rubicundus]|uniref:uncharacterized protein LOC143352205 n=1 Tax=Halictus rubicundus TaxID=77578 RepID=UPI004035513A
MSCEMISRNTISQSVKYGLHFIGIWPGTPFSGLRIVFWLLATVFCQIYQYKYMITHFNTDGFIEMIYSLSLAMAYTLLIGKLIVAWINHGVLREIISTMEDDCAKYATLDRNNVISKTGNLSFRLTGTLPAFHMLSITCIAVGTVVIPQSTDSNDRPLPMDMDLPFDTNQSPIYELVLAAQLIFQWIAGYTYCMFSTFLLMLILHAGCVIDILCYIITHSMSSQNEGYFRFVAMRHQEIILFTKRIEQLFSYIAFCQLLSSTPLICGLGYQLITALQVENGLPVIVRCSVLYVAVCLEIFVYCFAGEYLNTKSKMIVDAIYETPWYNLQPSASRRLVLLILKSQMGLPLTIGKFSALSLQSFASWQGVVHNVICGIGVRRNLDKKRNKIVDKLISRETMSRNTVSQSVRYGLHFIGLWPGTPFPGLRKVCWLLSVFFCQIYQYKYTIRHIKTDGFVDTIYSLSFAVAYTALVGYLVIAWVNHGVLREILSTMEDDCVKYAAHDKNNVISKTADLSFRLTSTIPALHMLSTSCIAVGTLVIPQSNDSNSRQLLMDMDVPFDTNQSPTYELVLAAQIIFQGLAGYTYSMFCSFLLMSILHAGCVIDILCYIITHSISTEDEGQFRLAVMRHQEIILFTKRIEQLFSYIAFCQLLSSTPLICGLGYQLITAVRIENGLPVIVRSFILYFAMCIEIFVYCFAGEYLNTKSKMIVDAIYETPWYNLQPTTGRRLVLLILKSQVGLPLTCGKFSSLSLQSFASFMKASASYMSVLLAMS